MLDEIYEGKVKLCDRIDCRKSVEMYNIDNYFDNIKRILGYEMTFYNVCPAEIESPELAHQMPQA